MNYAAHYQRLVSRARERVIGGYVERHHILARCMGGSDDPSNLVALTPEEHFVAHQLLVKIHPGNAKLVHAVWGMTQGTRRNNKKFGWLRRLRAELQRGTTHTAKARAKIGEASRGRRLGDERAEALHAARRAAGTSDAHREKLSLALLGKGKSDAHRAAMSAARKAMTFTPEQRAKFAANKGKPISDRQRAAMLAAIKGKPLSDEHKKKVADAKRGVPQPTSACPHCPKVGGASLMKRWHFDNCRQSNG